MTSRREWVEYVAIPTKEPSGSTAPNWVLSTSTRGHGLGSDPIPAEEYLIDDGSPVEEPISDAVAEKVMGQVSERFAQRFAHMTSSRVAVKRHPQQNSVIIDLTGHFNKEQQKMFEVIGRALNDVIYMDSGICHLLASFEVCD